MKKLLLTLTGLGLCISSASANIVGVSAGMERQNISGYVKTNNTVNYFQKASAETDKNNNTGNLGLKDRTNPYLRLNLNLPLPVIPNFQFQYTKYHSTGHSNYIAGNVKLFDDVNVPVALTDASTKLDINSYDITAYYNISFIPLVNLKIGAGADIWKGKTKIVDNSTKKTVVNQDFTVILPYVYGNFQTDTLKGFSLYGTLKWAKSGDDHHYDYYGGLKYSFSGLPAYIKLGYRVKDVKGTNSDDNTETKIKYQGGYLELGLSY